MSQIMAELQNECLDWAAAIVAALPAGVTSYHVECPLRDEWKLEVDSGKQGVRVEVEELHPDPQAPYGTQARAYWIIPEDMLVARDKDTQPSSFTLYEDLLHAANNVLYSFVEHGGAKNPEQTEPLAELSAAVHKVEQEV